jgi:glycosyltransferase involved in cell wall biosynthesis
VVSTVHDVNPLLPDGRPWALRLWRSVRFRFAIRSNIRRSWKIVADTHFARDSVERAFRGVRGRMAVVPLFADARIRRLSDAECATGLAAFELDPGYILFVGSLRRHKNWDGLLRAYALLPPALRSAHRLVLAGPAHRAHGEAADLARRLGVDDRLTVLGTVPDASLPALYSGAALFAFPSFLEGFGLPPLEAMACGVPVVATNRTSVPEVLGEAALYVDPADMPGMANAMRRVLDDGQTASDLVRRGAARAALYSPERTASAMLPLLREAKGLRL